MTGVQEADEGTRTRLKRVAERTAAANEATADAMTQTAGIRRTWRTRHRTCGRLTAS